MRNPVESIIHIMESRIQNPESKTVLDYLAWGDGRLFHVCCGYIQGRSFNSFGTNTVKLVGKKQNGLFRRFETALTFLKFWFQNMARARKATWTFQKRAPGQEKVKYEPRRHTHTASAYLGFSQWHKASGSIATLLPISTPSPSFRELLGHRRRVCYQQHYFFVPSNYL